MNKVMSIEEKMKKYKELKNLVAEAEAKAKELLAEIVEDAEQKEGVYGAFKLSKVNRAGSVSYSQIVKVMLPTLDLEPYRGKSSEYWTIK